MDRLARIEEWREGVETRLKLLEALSGVTPVTDVPYGLSKAEAALVRAVVAARGGYVSGAHLMAASGIENAATLRTTKHRAGIKLAEFGLQIVSEGRKGYAVPPEHVDTLVRAFGLD